MTITAEQIERRIRKLEREYYRASTEAAAQSFRKEAAKLRAELRTLRPS